MNNFTAQLIYSPGGPKPTGDGRKVDGLENQELSKPDSHRIHVPEKCGNYVNFYRNSVIIYNRKWRTLRGDNYFRS